MEGQMPISLVDLANERRKLHIEFRNVGTMVIVYRPNVITPAKEAELRREAENEDEDEETTGSSTLLLLQEVLESWDLTGPLANRNTGEELVPQGEPVPLSDINILRHVPNSVCLRILREIGKDANPDPNGRGKSGGRSRRED